MADNDPSKNGIGDLAAVVEELKRESERLRKLAEELEARQEADAEMRANYPHYKKIIDDLLQKHIDREIPPLPEGKDLETIAAEEGALPLEDFIDELMK
jgi:hypothetical protein